MNYGTLIGALAYHTVRANASWLDGAVTDQQRTAALVRASAWIDGEYGPRFPGAKTGGRSQPLLWPRTGAADVDGNELEDNEIPFEVENSVYEAAIRELANPGSLSPDYVASERVKAEKVGDLSVTYADGSGGIEDVKPVLSIIDGILAGLLVQKPSGTTVVGFAARA